jgi:putative transposase
MIDQAVAELTAVVGLRGACAAVGEAQARWYRRHRQSPLPSGPEQVSTPQPRALSEVERKELRRVLNSEEFVDEAPATVYAKLLDQGVYLASVPTMYRVLRDHGEVHERRRQATHPAAKKPELLATKPNEVYSWTSPSCSARPSGPGSTCTCLSTSTRGMCRAGCWPTPRTPAWPRRC